MAICPPSRPFSSRRNRAAAASAGIKHDGVEASQGLTRSQIKSLIEALPDCTEPRKKALLSKILSDWAKIDLEGHRSRSSARTVQLDKKQLESLARNATALKKTLEGLRPVCRLAVAQSLSFPAPREAREITPRYKVLRTKRRLEQCATGLERLALAADTTAKTWLPIMSRKETLFRYLVLDDMAAFFIWATDLSAARRVRTDERAGEEYGPFLNFAGAVWNALFGSTRGLHYSMRAWQKLSAKHNSFSPLIANTHFRHPEWRILEL
jgi:hypothetical protein